MNIAVSNIAWTAEEEDAVADKLIELGVKYVEIAPTKRWEDPTSTSVEDALEYLRWWNEKGIEVVAFQSMLFARPDLKIFESEENRQETIQYMKKFIELAGTMGVKRMVFGSPKNRQVGATDQHEAYKIAQEFFKELGDFAKNNGVVLCLEPNAPQYACDFITNSAEGLGLVKTVGSEGFGLHLDTACMALAGDNIEESILSAGDSLKHFHVSAPMLGTVDEGSDIAHTGGAKALHTINYEGFVSIEMRPGEVGENVQRVSSAVNFVKEVYGA